MRKFNCANCVTTILYNARHVGQLGNPNTYIYNTGKCSQYALYYPIILRIQMLLTKLITMTMMNTISMEGWGRCDGSCQLSQQGTVKDYCDYITNAPPPPPPSPSPSPFIRVAAPPASTNDKCVRTRRARAHSVCDSQLSFNKCY